MSESSRCRPWQRSVRLFACLTSVMAPLALQTPLRYCSQKLSTNSANIDTLTSRLAQVYPNSPSCDSLFELALHKSVDSVIPRHSEPCVRRSPLPLPNVLSTPKNIFRPLSKLRPSSVNSVSKYTLAPAQTLAAGHRYLGSHI